MGLFLTGATIPFNELKSGDNLVLEQMIETAGGLTLSQVSTITGLEGSTIQNWIKRGWVAKPVKKRYYKKHLFRILIIGILRDCMQLEQIVSLLKVVNYYLQQQDKADNESMLFNYLCSVVDTLSISNGISKEKINSNIELIIKDFSGSKDAKVRLKEVLSIMTYGYITSLLKNETEMYYNEFMAKQGEF